MDINKTKNIINNIPNNVLLVAVTKNQTKYDIDNIYQLGIRDFGENKLQAILEKKDLYPNVDWHFIGRIQTNKVKDIVKNCKLIHSVSSIKVLEKINIEASKINKVQSCLLQFNIACEDTKDGFKYEEATEILNYTSTLKNIKIEGIMLMGPNTTRESEIKKVFQLGKKLQQSLVSKNPNLIELSMGMSNDYQLAIKYNSTILRIGSLLFK